MVQYNFKSITVVPDSENLIDIVLSRTQRQTPTVVHKEWAISRIRQFYMRKVKYTQENFVEKLSTIVNEFPRLDGIHPFYGDFFHVLYDKDHYKLALGQVNVARNLIGNISRDYVKLLKYGDSLYRCKCLKVSALGRMTTVIKRINPSLAYLEEIRQHMARLPSIDPTSRTILLCGHPNVGKSSFMNKITRADVDVQPYAFTTKSLFVGHTDYEYLRYQVIDTPGILDRPLERHNIMEMCSITALAHLQAVVLFFLDISGSCGYSIAEQAALFHSIKSLLMNKPLIIVCNKTDLQQLEGISAEDMGLIMEMKTEALKTVNVVDQGGEEGVLLTMSTLNKEGVIAVKNTACQMLLDRRVEKKMKSKKLTECLNRFHVGVVRPRDQKERPPCIPQAVLDGKTTAKEKRKTEKDLEEENGGAGVYSSSLTKNYVLSLDAWKGDPIPELVDGHNVSDFASSENIESIEKFLQEEGMGKEEADDDDDDDDDVLKLSIEEEKALAVIRKMKASLIHQHRMKKSTAGNRPCIPRKYDKDRQSTSKRMGRQLSALLLDPSKAISRVRGRSVSRRGRKRRLADANADGDAMDMDMDMGTGTANKKRRLISRSRLSISRPPTQVVPAEGSFKDSFQKMKAAKLAKKSLKKRNKDARRGEADRVIPSLRPKHLFSGKRSIGKNQRR